MRRALAVLALAAVVVPARPAAAVVDGEPADPGEWPWQVLVETRDFACGGALLAMDVVLTAAHCVDDVEPDAVTVRAGMVDLDDDAQARDVAAVHVHEGYVESEADDIAVLRLETPMEPGGAVEAVALPDAETAASLTVPGSPVFVTGFGATDEDGAINDELLEGEVEIVDDGTCGDRYDVEAATTLCAGLEEGGTDACFGDSGGPLVVPADEDRTGWYLLGIVSFGDGCGRPQRPTVYTEVAAYGEFLAEAGALAPPGERFASGGGLALPAFGTRGKASEYPSSVDVDDAPDGVTGVAVELRGLTHERPSDLDLWLRAPDGTVVTLVSDVGGPGAVEDLDLVVEAGGAAAGDRPLPRRAGSSDREPGDQLDGSGFGALDLEVLEGEWELLVADDRAGASGSLDGWSLVLVTG
jgi:hypothetical protein